MVVHAVAGEALLREHGAHIAVEVERVKESWSQEEKQSGLFHENHLF